MIPAHLEDGALQDVRVAGGVLGDAIKALWRDEFTPSGEWRTFTSYAWLEADRLEGVLVDLAEAVAEVSGMVARVSQGAMP